MKTTIQTINDSIVKNMEEIEAWKSLLESEYFKLNIEEIVILFDDTEMARDISSRINHDALREVIRKKFPEDYKKWLYENGKHSDLKYFILKERLNDET